MDAVWMRIIFRPDVSSVSEKILQDAIRTELGNSVRRTLVKKKEVWVCFDDVMHIKGRSFRIDGRYLGMRNKKVTCVLDDRVFSV